MLLFLLTNAAIEGVNFTNAFYGAKSYPERKSKFTLKISKSTSIHHSISTHMAFPLGRLVGVFNSTRSHLGHVGSVLDQSVMLTTVKIHIY